MKRNASPPARRSGQRPFEEKRGDRNFVTALAKGLRLLAQFSPERPRLSLSELSQQSGLPKTTTFRLLKTLAELGYVGYDPMLEVYFPGPGVMSLGFSALATMEIREIARPYLAKLSRTIDETVNLAVRDDLEIVYCERIATRKLIHINVGPGIRLPVHNTSLDRCLVAFLPPSDRNRIVAKLKASIDSDSFQKLLQQVRFGHQSGYTISDGDLEPGIRAIAMPVWGMGNSLNAATNVAVPASRMTLQQIRTTIAPALFECTKGISISAGASETWVAGRWREVICS